MSNHALLEERVSRIESGRNDLYEDELILEAFLEQGGCFKKRVSPFERNKFFDHELDNFVVSINSIDRVYSCHHKCTLVNVIDPRHSRGVRCVLEIYFRTKYLSKFLFVGMDYERVLNYFETGHEHNAEIACGSRSGALTLSYDVDIFTKSMVKHHFDVEAIYFSLKKDIYAIFGNTIFNSFFHSRSARSDATSLEIITLFNICKKMKYIFSPEGEILLPEGVIPLILNQKLVNFFKYFYTREYFYKQTR